MQRFTIYTILAVMFIVALTILTKAGPTPTPACWTPSKAEGYATIELAKLKCYQSEADFWNRQPLPAPKAQASDKMLIYVPPVTQHTECRRWAGSIQCDTTTGF